MGSLPMNGNTLSKFVSTTSAATCTIPSLFRERSKSRSPIQSPPLPKRSLQLVEGGKEDGKNSERTLARHPGNQKNESRIKENKSILKTSSSRRSRSKDDLDRKVNFRPKVVVFHFDRERGRHVSCESQALNVEPETRNTAAQNVPRQNSLQGTTLPTHLRSILTNHNEVRSSADRVGNSRGNCNGTPTPRRRSLSLPKSREDQPTVFDDIHFQYFVDDSRNSILRFSLPLGLGTSASDVIVKANKDGDRIRVLSGSGPDPSSSGNRCREMCERFALPVRVDSYQISARIDAGGVLFVEAPILPGELSKPGLRMTRKAV